MSNESEDLDTVVSDDQNENIETESPIPSDLISKPIMSRNCTIPDNVLEFQHSYGYNCKKKFNICVVGGTTVIFISGNILTFLDIETRKLSFRRSAIGGGIGFVCANPTSNHFAVGEKGKSPPIIVYEWPSLEPIAILKKGTKRGFTYLSFSPGGELLCSQGAAPDFFITIWDWMHEKIVLQCKSYGQEVSKCIFSQHKTSVLISTGYGHIKFWKIAQTFTGLKLEGELGIFDKVEASDIISILPMPNGMVLTGCEWGNMLLWNGTTIKYEISKRIPKTCHDGAITTIAYDAKTDRLLTIGMDGCVKVWAYGPIHKTEMAEDMFTVGCLPIEEFEMRNTSAAFLSAETQYPNDKTKKSWIVQDANGAIWRMNLSFTSRCHVVDCLFHAPAGKIVGMACSPAGSLIGVLSEEGGLYIYDWLSKELRGYKLFPGKGSCLFWIPLKVDLKGSTLILGFANGIIRIVSINLEMTGKRSSDDLGHVTLFNEEMRKKLEDLAQKRGRYASDSQSLHSADSSEELVGRIRGKSFWVRHSTKHMSLKLGEATKILDENLKEEILGAKADFALSQILRPHTGCISCFSVNSDCTFFMSGSHDGTAFLFDFTRENRVTKLNPIGFVQAPSEVTHIEWKPNEPNDVLVCCSNGNFFELTLPLKDSFNTESSYRLSVERKSFTFKSVKSQILRDEYLKKKEERKAKKLERKKEELEAMKERGRLDVDPDTYLIDSEEEEELEPLYFPEKPNPILFGFYSETGSVRLSVGGYDAGFLYEYNFETPNPIACPKILGAEDMELHSYILSPDKKYLIFGMADGKIRVNRMTGRDLVDLTDYWELPMHDSSAGEIRKMCFNIDGTLLFTCGNDGNIFSYHFKGLSEVRRKSDVFSNSHLFRRLTLTTPVVDISADTEFLSLEQSKEKIVEEKRRRAMEKNKVEVLEIVSSLQARYNDIKKRNLALPDSQRFSQQDFELHPDITSLAEKYNEDKMSILHRRYAWNLEKSKLAWEKIANCFINDLASYNLKISGYRNNITLDGYRLKKLTKEFHEIFEATTKKINSQDLNHRKEGEEFSVTKAVHKPLVGSSSFDTIMRAFALPGNLNFSKMGIRAIRIMENYVAHKQKIDKRNAEWDMLLSGKPSDKENHSVDLRAIEDAKISIGDYKLKTSKNYRVPSHLRVTADKKYEQVLKTHLKIYETKEEYNNVIRRLSGIKDSLSTYSMKLLSHLECVSVDKSGSSEGGQNLIATKIRNLEELLEKNMSGTEQMQADLTHKYQRLKKKIAQEMDWVHEIDGRGIQEESISELTKEELEKAASSDTSNSPWESHAILLKRIRQSYNAEIILETVEQEITSFDDEIKTLSKQKSNLDLRIKYLEQFLITLLEELMVIKNFESIEEALLEKVQDKLEERNEMLEKIYQLKSKLDARKIYVDSLHETQKDIMGKFQSAIENSSSASLLKRLFKKKFKPPRIKADDESSEEESSSSESSSDSSESDEDDDFASIMPTRIDENVCPEGCPPELFQLTLSLRSQRHLIEKDLIDEKKHMDILKKDLDVNNKKLKTIENAYQKCDEDLDAYQRQKQNELNDLDVTVLLNLSQLQHLRSPTDLGAISESILFSKKRLIQLSGRKHELEKETKLQGNKHRALQKHMHRLKVDCEYMKKRILELEGDLKVRMKKKFGQEVSILNLEQSILRKHIMEFRNQIQDLRGIYAENYAEFREQLNRKLVKYTEVISTNTEKLSLLAALQEEKTKLDKILRHQNTLKTLDYEERIISYQSDIAKLEEIKCRQSIQKQSLKEEISKLSHKSRVGDLPPLELNQHRYLDMDFQSSREHSSAGKMEDKDCMVTTSRASSKEDHEKS